MYSAILRLELYSALVEQLVTEEDVWTHLDGTIEVSTFYCVPAYPRLKRRSLPVWRAFRGEVENIRRNSRDMVREILSRRLGLNVATEEADCVQSPLL